MGFSRLEYPYTGGAQDFQIDFALGILENDDVTVYVIGEVDGLGEQIYRDFTFIDEGNIRVTDPLPNPSTVVIDRTVDKDSLEIDIESTGPVTRVTLARAFRQAMMNIHELLDGRVDSFTGAILDALAAVRNEAVAAKDDAVTAKDAAEAVVDQLDGDLVDTDSTQTLTNKTHITPTIRSPAIRGQNGVTYALDVVEVDGQVANGRIIGDASTGLVAQLLLGGKNSVDVTKPSAVLQAYTSVNTAGAEVGSLSVGLIQDGVVENKLNLSGDALTPAAAAQDVDLGTSSVPFNAVYADNVYPLNGLLPQFGGHGHVAADNYGAAGDGVIYDTAAIDAAYAVSRVVYLSPMKVYRYAGVPPSDIVFIGEGLLRYEEPGYPPQTWGNTLHAGTPNTRGGIQRADRAGGVFYGELADNRGVVMNVQGCSSYLFAREQSDEGQSLLLTYMPTPRYERVQGTQGTNTFQPLSGTFNTSFFQTGRRVMVNGVLCRITAASTTSCTVKKDPSILAAGEVVGVDDVISWDTNFVDSALIPQHAWKCTADINGTAVTITDGIPEDLKVIPSEVMVKIDGTYYQVVSATDAFNLVIDTSLPVSTGETVEISWQREYMVQDTLKWNGGEHEQTYKVGLTAAYIEFDSSNSGQSTRNGEQWHRGYQFSIDNVPRLQIDEGRVRVMEDFVVLGNTTVQQLSVGTTLISDFQRPSAPASGDVGSNNFPYQRVTATRFFAGSAGATEGGWSGTFATGDARTATVVGGIITDVS